MPVPLMTLHRHRRAIAVAWWFGFLGGPVWGAVLVILAGRRLARRPEEVHP